MKVSTQYAEAHFPHLLHASNARAEAHFADLLHAARLGCPTNNPTA